jgi:hypothetical protein
MSESTVITAESSSNVFVDSWDDGAVWLSIQTMHGGAHCVITPENARAMIVALKAVIGEDA